MAKTLKRSNQIAGNAGGLLSAVSKIIKPPKTAIYWIIFCVWAVFFLALFRLIFLIRHLHLADEISIGDIFVSFIYGAKFDLAIISYIVIPIMLISFLPKIGFDYSKLSRKILQTIMYVLFCLVFLLSLIDIEYYGYFGDHLGVWSYAYLDHFEPIFYSIVEDYPVFWYLLGWAFLSVIFIFVANRFNRIYIKRRSDNILARLLYFILITALLVISMRGGVSLAPIDWASAYHSNDVFANELSLNGVYTLSRNLYEYYDDVSRHQPTKYQFSSDEEALKTVQGLVCLPSDSLIQPDQSLKRLSKYPGRESKDNVIIIVMESWAARFVGAYGNQQGITPFFDSLADKSLLLKNFYASGLRTNRGLLSVLCSFPSLPGRTVMKLYGAEHPFMSTAEILKQRGYESYFIYGGDLDFDNMGGFFRMKGFENFIGINDFPSEAGLSKWGVPDHLVFEKANEIFAGQSREPFLGVVLTLSNHEPFTLPEEKFEKFSSDVKYRDYLNTFYYSDWALGRFFEAARQEDYFNNTIFVLVGDHGRIVNDPNDIVNNFKIASLIYCPGRADISPRTIETICGQVDLLPTILGLLGQFAVHESWGRDIFSLPEGDNGYAFLNKGDAYGLVRDSLLFWEKIDFKPRLYDILADNSIKSIDITAELPENVSMMQTQGRAMLQLEVDLVHGGLATIHKQ